MRRRRNFAEAMQPVVEALERRPVAWLHLARRILAWLVRLGCASSAIAVAVLGTRPASAVREECGSRPDYF